MNQENREPPQSDSENSTQQKADQVPVTPAISAQANLFLGWAAYRDVCTNRHVAELCKEVDGLTATPTISPSKNETVLAPASLHGMRTTQLY